MNTKLKIGITGQAGFVGTHLFHTLALYPDSYERIPFEDSFFLSQEALENFVSSCDVIVHLAAVNRAENLEELYNTNISLVSNLIAAMEKTSSTPLVLFSSSIQEKLDNPYGKSKVEGRLLFEAWAKKNNASFISLLVPNVFGPFCKPNYNSFVATFCHKLTHGEEPQVLSDSSVKLISVSSLCAYIIETIEKNKTSNLITQIEVPYDFEKKVTEILVLLQTFKEQYFDQGSIPFLKNDDDIALFNTFCSYIDHEKYFPRKLRLNTDERGSFVETIRLGVGGQVSFSTTVPGITRGNHYHTRKIERFTVIKGKALIEIRKIGTNKILSFILDGTEPSYVDMPIWYTHNITNVGTSELFTQFWINEWYDESNPDTYFEKV